MRVQTDGYSLSVATKNGCLCFYVDVCALAWLLYPSLHLAMRSSFHADLCVACALCGGRLACWLAGDCPLRVIHP